MRELNLKVLTIYFYFTTVTRFASDSNGEKWVDPHSEEAFFKADLLRDDWVDPTNPTVEFFNNKYEDAGGAREFVDPTDMGMPSPYSKPLSEEVKKSTEGRGTQTDEKQLNSSMETPNKAGTKLISPGSL